MTDNKVAIGNLLAYPPDYRMAIRLAVPTFLCLKRSFRGDALIWLRELKPAPVVTGKSNIPQKGPFLLVINHYWRVKYRIWWSVLAASAIIPAEIRWVMTEAWTFPNRPLGRYLEGISRLIFRRIARMYDFFLMPPMPPRPWEIEARARAVLCLLDFVKKNPNAAIGLAPEGGDSQSGALEMPAPGVGRFLLHLAHLGLPICPLGVFEAEGALHLNFGKPINLNYSSKTKPESRDQLGSQIVMRAIAELLPTHLRGVFDNDQH
jgi:hypothetical protein